MTKTMNSNVQIANPDLELGSEFEKTNLKVEEPVTWAKYVSKPYHRSENEDRSEAERRRRDRIGNGECGATRSEMMDDGGSMNCRCEILVLGVSPEEIA
ncbi:hypothetical protein A2U01_0000272 [Trifolium medium]|uniref:Uncharacterized protein n=1 Tax=Trifolium medium TaxID=97028 RepID=A0A392LX41_9FABA|nr:hypothetical protein [Trifolium medium]